MSTALLTLPDRLMLACAVLLLCLLAGENRLLLMLLRLPVLILRESLAPLIRRLDRPARSPGHLRQRGASLLAVLILAGLGIGLSLQQIPSPGAQLLASSAGLLLALGFPFAGLRAKIVLDELAAGRPALARSRGRALNLPHPLHGSAVAAPHPQPFGAASAEDDHDLARSALESVALGTLPLLIGPVAAFALADLPGLTVYALIMALKAQMAGRASAAFAAPAEAAARLLNRPLLWPAAQLLALASQTVPHADPGGVRQGRAADLSRFLPTPDGRLLAIFAGATGSTLGGGPWIGQGSRQVGGRAVQVAITLQRGCAVWLTLLCGFSALALQHMARTLGG